MAARAGLAARPLLVSARLRHLVVLVVLVVAPLAAPVVVLVVAAGLVALGRAPLTPVARLARAMVRTRLALQVALLVALVCNPELAVVERVRLTVALERQDK